MPRPDLLEVEACDLRRGHVVVEDGQPLYRVVEVTHLPGWRVEVITSEGFPVDMSADDLVTIRVYR